MSAPNARPLIRSQALRPLALAVHLGCAALLLTAGTTTTALASEAATVNAAVPAGPLADALNRFALQAGVSIALDASRLQGRQAPALAGRVSVEEGFRRLLEGSGYRADQTAAGYVLVASAAAGSTSPASPVTTAVLPALTVTGEKIERDLLQTNTSVGVVDARRIEQTGVQTLPQAFRLLGNVRDADFIDAGILIRGINSEGVGGPAGRPLATVTIDGVAQTDQGVRRGALGLWDVEQLEVLRGPQSTLSGRNALAGAIHLRTFDPSFEPEAAVQLNLGSSDKVGMAAMLSGPVTEQLAYRLTVERLTSDGFVDYPGYAGLPRIDERETDEYWQWRGKLLWQPQDEQGLRVLLSHASAYDSPAYDDVDGPSAGVDFFDRTWGAQSVAVFDEARSTRNQSTALDISLPLTDGLRFTSLTTHVNSETNRGSVDLASRGLIEQRELAQEFRVNLDRGPVKAVAGLYFNRERFDNERDQVRPWQPNLLRRDLSDGEVRNEAVFGEVNLRHGDFTWIAGARYDREKQTTNSTNTRIDIPSDTVISSSSNSTTASYDAFLPKIGVNWQFASSQSLGLTLQQGYRAGGAAIDPLTSQPYTYEPEEADNIEISYRWQSMDDRWRLALNLFHMRWKDQQINVPQIPGDFTSDKIINAGSSTIKGGEIELQGRPSRAWDLFASIGLADTEFNDFAFSQGGTLLDLKGSAFPQAPKWTAAVGAHWNRVGWFAGGDLKFTGKALSRSVLEGVPPDNLPSYTVLNLRAGYQWGNYRLAAYVDNATDEEYFLYRYNDPAFQVATVGRPRTVGLVFDAQF